MIGKLHRFKLRQSVSDMATFGELADKVDKLLCVCHDENPGDVLLIKSELLLEALLSADKSNQGVVPLLCSQVKLAAKRVERRFS